MVQIYYRPYQEIAMIIIIKRKRKKEKCSKMTNYWII